MKYNGALLCLVICLAVAKAISISGSVGVDRTGASAAGSFIFPRIPAFNVPFANLFGLRTTTRASTTTKGNTSGTTISVTTPSSVTSSSSNSGGSSGTTQSSNDSSSSSTTQSINSGTSSGTTQSSNGGSSSSTTQSSNSGSSSGTTQSSNGGSSSSTTQSSNGGSSSSTTQSSNGSSSSNAPVTNEASTTTSSSSNNVSGRPSSARTSDFLSLFNIPSGASLIPDLSSNGGSSNMKMPTIPGLDTIAAMASGPAVDTALKEAEDHMAEALSISGNITIGLDQAVQDALASGDPAAALGDIAQTIIDSYLAVAANCPFVTISARVFQQGLILAGDVVQAAINVFT